MMSSREGPQREGPEDYAPPWCEAFKQQYSDEMMQRLEIFTAHRLAGIGRRVTQGHEQQARDIVASVAFDSLHGLVRWQPDRKDLESHLKTVIKRRTSLDWKRAKSAREESLDATDADGHSTIREEVEYMLQAQMPDPVSTQKAARTLAEIERIADADPDFAAFLDARADGLRASAVMRRTGLSRERYRRCRRLLADAADQVSFHVRPWRRKREKPLMSHHDKRNRTARDPIAIMEDLLDDVAEQAVEDLAPTADSIRWSRALGDQVRRELARMERRGVRARDVVRPSVAIPAEIQALDRDSMLARLECLRQSAKVQYAHRDLSGLSDDELRRMLAHALTLTGRE